MKKKTYYIIYSIVQMIVSIYMFIFAKDVVASQVEMLEEAFSALPPETSDVVLKMFNGSEMIASTKLCSVIALVFAFVLLLFAIKDKMLWKKGLTVGLLIASMFLLNDLILVLALIALILVLNTKVQGGIDKKKEKKEIQKLRPLNVTGKDYVWGVVLVFAYCTQFVLPYYINNFILSVVFEVLYYVLLIVLAFYVFAKRFKRDFTSFKENLGTYLGYAFKWWGIMLGLSAIAGIIRMVLGGAVETANQATLNGLPLWYVVPLAVIWAPIIEETIFRGVLRRFVKNDKLFIVLSAIIFGLLHTVGTEVGLYNILIQSLQYMVMGGVMAYVYVKTNNIFTNMTVHCIQNSFGVIFMILMSIM